MTTLLRHNFILTSLYFCCFYLICIINLTNAQSLTTVTPMMNMTMPSFTFVGSNTSALDRANTCNPRDYTQRGYCTKYFTCNRKSRQEIKRACSDGLFWNPNVNSIHGGVCDYLRNKEKETLFDYKKDTKCVLDVAYFRMSGECSPKYFFHHPIRTEGKEIEEICPEGLIWSKDKESCDICTLVKKKDGITPCCDESNNISDY